MVHETCRGKLESKCLCPEISSIFFGRLDIVLIYRKDRLLPRTAAINVYSPLHGLLNPSSKPAR